MERFHNYINHVYIIENHDMALEIWQNKEVYNGVISVKSSVWKKDPCSSIFCAISIDCEGNVFPCNSIPFKVGNIYEDSICNIWNHSEKLKFIQGIRKSDLSECVRCKYEPICERCPGMALLEGKGLFSCDPLAKRVAEVRMQD